MTYEHFDSNRFQKYVCLGLNYVPKKIVWNCQFNSSPLCFLNLDTLEKHALEVTKLHRLKNRERVSEQVRCPFRSQLLILQNFFNSVKWVHFITNVGICAGKKNVFKRLISPIQLKRTSTNQLLQFNSEHKIFLLSALHWERSRKLFNAATFATLFLY